MNKEQNSNNSQIQSLNIPVVRKRLFLCDICGQEKSGKKYPVLDENWNKQSGLNQCEDCYNKLKL